MDVTPHIAQNTARSGGSVINDRTTRYAGYALGQRKRKRIEAFEKAEEPITTSEVANEMDLNPQRIYNILDRQRKNGSAKEKNEDTRTFWSKVA